ncbi:MAG: PIN domain-containing protein, partial [Thermomicrobiales bacterium]
MMSANSWPPYGKSAMRQSREPIRAVVDSNVFVSGLILQRGKPFELLNAWRRQAFVLHMADEQREELRDVLSRRELIEAYQVTQEDRDRRFSLLDNDDVHILAAALGGKADYLVTGDRKAFASAGWKTGAWRAPNCHRHRVPACPGGTSGRFVASSQPKRNLPASNSPPLD